MSNRATLGRKVAKVTQLVSVAWGEQSADHDLISCTRDGDTGAFAVLYERHSSAARTVARQYLQSVADAEDVVSEAFAKVLKTLRNGAGPDAAFRAYLFTIVRRLSFQAMDHSRRITPSDDDVFEIACGPSASSDEPTLRKLEHSLVTNAYKSLPERWQSALWYSEVEGMAPADFATLVGLSANGAAALAYRAREGLRQSYLQHHLQALDSPDCAAIVPMFSKYVRGATSKRDTTAIESHLVECSDCAALVVELEDLSSSMRTIIAPLVLGTVGIAALDLLPAAEVALATNGSARRSGQPGRTQWALAAAGVVVVAALGVGLAFELSRPTSSPQVADAVQAAVEETSSAAPVGPRDQRVLSTSEPAAEPGQRVAGPWADPTPAVPVASISDGNSGWPPEVTGSGTKATDAATDVPEDLPVAPPIIVDNAVVSVALSPTSALVARQPSPVELIFSNSGGAAAQDVTVAVLLPASVTYVQAGGPAVPLFAQVLTQRSQPGCSATAGAGKTIVRCIVGEIAAGGSSRVSLSVVAQTSGTVEIETLTSIGLAEAEGWTFIPTVAPAPAHLEVSTMPIAALRPGVPGYLSVTVANAGELAAGNPMVELTVPAGFTWPADASGRHQVGGADWVCAAPVENDHTVLDCAAAEPVAGDEAKALFLPVEVASSVAPGAVVQISAKAAVSGGAWHASLDSSIPVSETGLSATAILSGQLQTAKVAADLAQPVDLTIPDGAEVLYSELTWSGTDAQRISEVGLASVRLQVVGRDQARETIGGAVVTGQSGPASFWAQAEVTAFVGQHPGLSTWSMVPVPGAALPTGLVWSLTVVYAIPDAPQAIVTVLSGPTGGSAPINLPVAEAVKVSGSGFTGGAVGAELVTMDSPVTQLLDPLRYTSRFFTTGLVSAADADSAGLGLQIVPSPSTIGLVVHATPDSGAPTGAVEQLQRPRQAGLDLHVTTTSFSGGTGMVKVRVTNPLWVPLRDARVILELPPSLQVVGQTGCTSGTSIACARIASLDPWSPVTFEVQVREVQPGVLAQIGIVASASDDSTGTVRTGSATYLLPGK